MKQLKSVPLKLERKWACFLSLMLYSFLEDQTKAIRNETEIRDVTIRKEEIIMVSDSMIRHRNCKGNNWKISYN